jgi:hypothetical protein
MAWEVWKWEDSGAVEFRIHAVSRPAPTDSVLVRVGRRLFMRREQLRFYRRCCERIARLTARELGLPDEPPSPAIRLREADAPETGGLGERLLARRTRRRA